MLDPRPARRTSACRRPGDRRRDRPAATFDFSFDLTNQYTFWSGTIAALFLFCSYFGTDQSQVQRYLTARSVDEARDSLLMSAYWKIPLQALVLLARRAGVRVLRVHAAAAAVQPACTSAAARGTAAPAEYAALRAAVRRGAAGARAPRRPAMARRASGGDAQLLAAAAQQFRRARPRSRAGARAGAGAGPRDDRRCGVTPTSTTSSRRSS